MTMPDDFTQRFQYGLNDLPLEPPDDPNTLFSPNGFTSIGMQRAGSAQVIPAQFRVLGRGMQPPGWYPNQGRGLAPGGGPVTEIPMPEAWKTLKTWGPLLPEILRSLHREFIDPALSGPDDSVYPMATLGRRRRLTKCEKQWADARDFCAKELAKPFPDMGRTGNHTDVEGCAKGYVDEPCGGNKKADGYPSGGGDSKKGGDPPDGGNSTKAGNSTKKKPRRRGPLDVDPDDVPFAPE
jgi:hypothetical protein